MYKDRKGKQTPEQKAIQQEARYAWRKSIKTRLVNHFGNRCVVCGNTYPQSVFDFHHKDPTQKEAQVGTMGSYEKCLKEAEKCILVCANCHRMIHNDEI
jgi:predicted HNH restriction endonuclease